MPLENSDTSSDWNQRQRALSRWDNEGGAGPDGPASDLALETERTAIPDLTNAELVTLRIRVIALENLMISLLATASDDQLRLAREMAGYISPRPGFTQHPLTIHAAAHMVDLVERANHFRTLNLDCAAIRVRPQRADSPFLSQLADIVAKVVLQKVSKILRAATPSYLGIGRIGVINVRRYSFRARILFCRPNLPCPNGL